MFDHFRYPFACCLAWIVLAGSMPLNAAVELVQLTEENWTEFAPAGKEADAIYGDFVLRNEHIVTVIARPTPTRNANMTVRSVGGMLIDCTQRNAPNDQLSAYYCNGMPLLFHDPETIVVRRDGGEIDFASQMLVQGNEVSWQCSTTHSATGAEVTLRYTLRDGQPFLQIITHIRNPHDRELQLELSDLIRADRTFSFGNDSETGLFWADDEWFRQAYGIMIEDRRIEQGGSRNSVLKLLQDDSALLKLPPSGTHQIERRFVPGNSLLQVRGLAERMQGLSGAPITVEVVDPAGPVNHARIVVHREGQSYGNGRTGRNGQLEFDLPPGKYTFKVDALGRQAVTQQHHVRQRRPLPLSFRLEACGYVRGAIRDQQGGPIPCKVAFYGLDGTPDPDFGPDSGAVSVQNLHYSHQGSFIQEILPGRYEAVISFGPEYDAVFKQIEVRAGEEAELAATLSRVVDTTGWVSSDFHSHSSPSGDNTSSQLGRVLNLLCEHVEFCPCTEHNRIDTYIPHLELLGVRHLMATCSGMELTGRPLPINHQNAFPLEHAPHTQDGGAPQTDENPVVQIERLALWDNNSDKLVQLNHPNLVQILGDRDLDGNADGGFRSMFGFMDVIEVHPPEGIFTKPARDAEGNLERNPIFHWMQLLNLGFRIPGVVNTDAHYNFHESGWLRNYLKSSTDDPAKIETMEMVVASERGNLIMTTGPFLEVTASAAGTQALVYPGDDLRASSGQVALTIRVQCSNWLDVNRVQVFVNGRAVDRLNRTRRTQPDQFANDVVKFEQTMHVDLEEDAHLIVAAIGEGLELGRVMGPRWGQKPPVAVSNPIFVDVDGDGFQANGDLLDLPLPYQAE